MKKAIMIFIIGGLLGAGGGFVLGIFFYPFIFLNDIVANDTIENRELKKLWLMVLLFMPIQTIRFIGVKGR
jgi:hypothetical protein